MDTYRGPLAAPHNAYRTRPAEDDAFAAWCAIACFSDEEWRRLVTVMGKPAWAADPAFGTLAGRLAGQAELDRHIEAWTRQLDKYEVMRRCQAAGRDGLGGSWSARVCRWVVCARHSTRSEAS